MATSWVKNILPKFTQSNNNKYTTLDDSKDTASITSLPFKSRDDPQRAQESDLLDPKEKDDEIVRKAELERKRKLRRIKKRHENGCACGRCLGVAIRREEKRGKREGS